MHRLVSILSSLSILSLFALFPAVTRAGTTLMVDGAGVCAQDVNFTGTFQINGAGIPTLPAGNQGDILYYNGSGWVSLGYGTSGYFLKTQGVSANPAWAVPSRTGAGRTLCIDAGALIPAVTDGAAKGTAEDATNKQTSDYLEFSASVEKYADFDYVMPEEWNNGTLKIKFLWTSGAAGGTGNIIWGAKAVAVSEGDPLDTAYGTAVEVTDAITTDNDNHTTAATSALTVGGSPAAGDLVRFRFYRKAADGSDTYDKVAWLKKVIIQYTETTTEPAAW